MSDIINFCNQQASMNTRRAYRLDLDRWAAFLGERQPTVDIAVEFKSSLEASLAPASAARVFAAVRSFYRWLGGENPFDRVKPPKRVTGRTPKTPTDEAVNRLLDAVDLSTVPGLRDRAIIALLANGLRAQEVADLADDGLYYEAQYGAWVLRVLGKGRKERLVPATDEAVQAVQAYRTDEERRYATLLFDFDGSRLTYRQVEEAVYRWAKRAGIEGMHPHALRHHYATRLTRGGAHILHLQKLLGHARADTTMEYVGLDLADLIDAARKDPRSQTETQPTLVAVAS